MVGESTAVEVTDEAVVDVEVDAEGVGGTGAAAATGAAVSAADEAATALIEAQKRVDEESRARQAAETRLVAERQRADAATRLAQQSEHEAATAREAQANSELQIVTTGLTTATAALAAAKAEMKRAYEAGEADAMVEAQARMADATADVKDFGRRKIGLEQRGPAPEVRPAPVAMPSAGGGSTFDQYIEDGRFAPAAKDWLRNHPDCAPGWAGGDDRKNNLMMQGHHAARAQGIPANTPQYFALIEAQLEGAAAATTTARPVPAAAPRKAPIPAAAPTNEPLAAHAGPTKRSVRLNPQQQETALFSYPAKPGEDDAAHRRRAFAVYAQEYIRAQAEGKIGRTTH